LIEKILNTSYYLSLVKELTENIEYNCSLLPITKFTKVNLSLIDKSINSSPEFDIIIKIPKTFTELIDELYSNFYLYIANQQFYENFLNPDFKIGELVVRKTGSKNRRYKIEDITEKKIILVEQKKETLKDLNGPAILYQNKKYFSKEFLPIKRPLKKRSLNNYLNLFSILNNLNPKVDFIPTKFNSVSVFIGAKKIFEGFRGIPLLDGSLWNSIPCYYLNRDGRESDTMGIEPILYFAPSYTVAYQQLLQNKINVSNIVLFNDGLDELQQIISDQSQYNFRIFGVFSSSIENRVATIKYWVWHKEEINLIGSL